MDDVNLAEGSADTEEDSRLVTDRIDELLRAFPPTATDPAVFLHRQFEYGLAWVHFPTGSGGLGVDPTLQQLVETALLDAGVSPRAREDMLGYRMGGPTVQRHGTPAQQRRFLLPAFTKQQRWCQLFSEPGSGSDLASVSTTATPDGSDWVLNGQKVWSSYALTSDLGMLLARTDPDAPKHKGLTFFIVDMDQPGVEVRPLRQLTGESEFNEVFLTDARVADDARIGPLGAGWRIAQTTLANERGMYGSRGFDRAAEGTAIATALQLYLNGHRGDSELRARLIRLWVDSQLLGWTARRIASTDPATAVPAPVGKLGFARIQQEGFDLALQLMGEDALDGAANGGGDRLFDERDPRHRYLRSRANSIEGGTSEIMKNILALRILGLPADERSDNRVPWSTLRRN